MLKSIFPFNPFNKNKASKEAAQNFLGGGGGSTSFLEREEEIRELDHKQKILIL